MKCTTKIVLGIIASTFAFSIILIIYAAITFDGRRNYYSYHYENRSYQISQENMKTQELPSFKVLYLTVDHSSDVDGRKRVEGGIALKPVQGKGDKNQITYTDNIASCIDYSVSNDTLRVKLKHGDVYNTYKDSLVGDWSYVQGVSLDLAINNSEIEIVSEIPRFGVTASDLEMSKVSLLVSECNVSITRSHIGELDARISPNGNSGSIHLDNCHVNTYNLDLDNLNGWTVVNSQIGTENLTGSGIHSVMQSKSESAIVNWIPKNKDAQMNVELRGDTTQIKFQ